MLGPEAGVAEWLGALVEVANLHLPRARDARSAGVVIRCCGCTLSALEQRSLARWVGQLSDEELLEAIRSFEGKG